jgi:alpha-beta hydrolase superfamily lysophospholipase
VHFVTRLSSAADVDATDFMMASTDGEQLYVCRWSDHDPPRAVIQIAHGMGEHAGRYVRLGVALVEEGYAVYAHDHRGHGRTAGDPARYGDLGAAGWDGLVADLGAVGARARADHPGVPLVLIGHSMGSFAVQQFLLDHSADVDGAVLSGSTAIDVVAAGIDSAAPADLTAFNAAFEPARTEFDWLSRDEEEVDAYIADPACGFGVDAAGVAQMMAHAAELGDPARLASIRPDLPIYIFSGDADPLAGGGELIRLLGSRYRDAGVTDVTVVLYLGARHETLNEINRDEVTADLIAWLDRIVR